MNIVIPKPVNEILNIIYDNNYEAYITGGTIRNMVMGEKIKNYNISTDASVDDIKRILKNYKTYYCGKDDQALAVVNSKFPMNIIQYCGDNNDPGEKCDCMKKIDLLPNTSSITKQFLKGLLILTTVSNSILSPC